MGERSVRLLQWPRRLAVATLCVLALFGRSAENARASGGGGHGAAEEEVAVESTTGFRGVELGEFSIRTIRTVPARRHQVSFVLFATIKSEHYKEFDKLYRQRTNKVRDQVIAATRLVPIEDYDDPELTRFRRRILLRLRRTLPELAIDNVFVSDFHLSIDGV